MFIKKICCIGIAAVMLTAGAGASVNASGWLGTKYVLSDGSCATGLKTINGIKYNFDSNGYLIGKYTGWTKNSSGQRNYYKDGKRRAGWFSANGKRYYGLYEGGVATGGYQIGDKIYYFNANGSWTGETGNAIVNTYKITDKIYADNLPDQIIVKWSFTIGDWQKYEIVPTRDSSQEPDIQRLENNKWVDVSINFEYATELLGMYPNLGEGVGDYILMDADGNPYPDDMLFEDDIAIDTFLYHDRLPAGYYRAAVPVEIKADVDSVYTDNLYCYFRIY